MSENIAALLRDLAADLPADPALLRLAIEDVLTGGTSPVQSGALLMGLRLGRLDGMGLAAAAQAMRNRMIAIDLGENLTDVCGTGGDGAGLLNISTAVAFVGAACGLRIAKHGNRAMTSRSGGADVLEALGLRLDAPDSMQQRAMTAGGLAFLFAQAHHPGLRDLAIARRELGFRTIFNVLGPLANPAGARQQLVGVFAGDLLEPMAAALVALGTARAWVVHGAGGLDEVSICGPTDVIAVADGAVSRFAVCPADAGLPEHPLDRLRGGSGAENATALRGVLAGVRDAYRDSVVLNTAATLVMTGRVDDLQAGARMAEAAIDTGAAQQKLDTLLAIQSKSP